MITLTHLDGHRVVDTYTLDKDVYIIGRSKENDLVFDSPKVSRMHAKLIRDNDSYLLQDLNSTNYVFVNGVRVKQKRLEDQDKVQISSEILLVFASRPQTTAPPPEKSPTLMDVQKHFVHREDLLRFKKVTQSILSLNNLDLILHNILKEGIGLTEAERGFIVLMDAQEKIVWKYATTYRIEIPTEESETLGISHSILDEAIAQKKIVVRLNETGPTQSVSQSMASFKIYSAMCAPLVVNERIIGLFYVDAKQLMNNFSEVDQFLFDFLADHAAMAIVNSKRFADLKNQLNASQKALQELEARYHALENRFHTLADKDEHKPVMQTYSAGGIVLGPSQKILLVNQNGTSWSFPKGQIEVGEEPLVTAQREIDEESGISFLKTLKTLPGYQRTALDRHGKEDPYVLKNIHMYLFSTNEETLNPKDPANPEARWVTYEEALVLLTHPDDQAYLQSQRQELKLIA